MNSFAMPWPVKEVWPNFRQSHHWRSYYKQRKDQRELAWALALQAQMRPVWNEVGNKVPVRVEIVPPDRRRRDRDGMIGACKGILDGLSDAISVNDQYFAPEYHFSEPCKPGKVIITIGEGSTPLAVAA